VSLEFEARIMMSIGSVEGMVKDVVTCEVLELWLLWMAPSRDS
jgi:hypothetical protein